MNRQSRQLETHPEATGEYSFFIILPSNREKGIAYWSLDQGVFSITVWNRSRIITSMKIWYCLEIPSWLIIEICFYIPKKHQSRIWKFTHSFVFLGSRVAFLSETSSLRCYPWFQKVSQIIAISIHYNQKIVTWGPDFKNYRILLRPHSNFSQLDQDLYL